MNPTLQSSITPQSSTSWFYSRNFTSKSPLVPAFSKRNRAQTFHVHSHPFNKGNKPEPQIPFRHVLHDSASGPKHFSLGPSQHTLHPHRAFRDETINTEFPAQTSNHSQTYWEQIEPSDPGVSPLDSYSDLSDSESSSDSSFSVAHGYQNKTVYEVLRLDRYGQVFKVFLRRRDLLREHKLQPRDLRRMDPTVDLKTSAPSISIKENAVLLNLGGIRAIVTAKKAMLFDPHSEATRKSLEMLSPRLKVKVTRTPSPLVPKTSSVTVSHQEYMHRYYQQQNQERSPPFELEVLEAALILVTSNLDAELARNKDRVATLLTKLPEDINPVNLEELRRIKQSLVELEDQADTVRELLEELMDDEDELRELNLSSRPRREERRRQRERDRLERELERAREIKEEIKDLIHDDQSKQNGGGRSLASVRSPSSGAGSVLLPGNLGSPASFGGHLGGITGNGTSGSEPLAQDRLSELRAKVDRDRLGKLRAKFDLRDKDGREREREERERDREYLLQRAREVDGDIDWMSRLEGSEEDIQDAQDALEEMVETEEEERELEEVEDLLEYYLQKASAIQSEAERLLADARDLEESIGVSLSARRFEVNRLELTLSIGSFAAALGAMTAGIFGMNMKSMLEMSVVSFWGVTGMIVFGCIYVFIAIMNYTRRKRIL